MQAPRVTSLLAFVLLAAMWAWTPEIQAEDHPPAVDWQETVSAFPAPAASAAFDAEGRIEADGTAVGTFHLGAEVDEAGEDARWRLLEAMDVTFDDARTAREARVLTDAGLLPLSGTLQETDEFGDRLEHTWRTTEAGYRVETKSESRAPMQRTAPQEGACLSTLTALVLFGRLAPKKDATYETRFFHPAWNYLEAEQPFVPARLTVRTVSAGEDGEALVVTAEQERSRVTVVLDAETRALREVRVRRRGRPALTLRPGPVGDAPPTDDLFAAPSPTEKGCAARVALAFATVDAALFEAVIHWPTLRANMEASIRGKVSDEAFRLSILGQFRKQGTGREPEDREETEVSLTGQAGDFGVESKGEAVAVVTLPEAWGRMRLTLCRVDGSWFLARLPGR